MQRSMRMGGVVAVILWCGWSVWAGQPSTQPPNWDQVDVFGLTLESGWVCPTPTGTTGTFSDVPGLTTSLTTSGGPVLILVQFNFFGPTL
jgi:hypothetical protein